MKRILVVAMLGAAACGKGSSGYSATYSGNITETYSCDSSSPPAFVLPDDTIELDVDGAGNATIYIGSCPGDTLYGVQNGNEVDIAQTTTFTCTQTDGQGTNIDITSIGGTLTFDSGGLDVDLTESAGINGDSCGGQATGALN